MEDWITIEEAQKCLIDTPEVFRCKNLTVALFDPWELFVRRHPEDSKIRRLFRYLYGPNIQIRRYPITIAILDGNEDLSLFLLNQGVPVNEDVLMLAILNNLSTLAQEIIRLHPQAVIHDHISGEGSKRFREPLFTYDRRTFWCHPDMVVLLRQEDLFDCMVDNGFWPSLSTILASGSDHVCQRALADYPYLDEDHRFENDEAIKRAIAILYRHNRISYFRYLGLLNPFWTSLPLNPRSSIDPEWNMQVYPKDSPSIFNFLIGFRLSEEILQALIDGGGDVFHNDDQGNSPLTMAIKIRDGRALSFFINKGLVDQERLREEIATFIVSITVWKNGEGNRQEIADQYVDDLNQQWRKFDREPLKRIWFC